MPTHPQAVPLSLTHRKSQDEPAEINHDHGYRDTISNPTYLSHSLYWTFFIYGFTFLLPWNAVIAAIPYFLTRIKGTGLENSFTSWVITVSSLSLLVFLWHATSTSSRPQASTRAIQSLLWTAILNLKLLIMIFIPMPPTLFAVLSVINALGQSVAAAYMQTAFWAIGSLFGWHALQALSVGGAAVGVAVGVIEVVSTYLTLLAKRVLSSDTPDLDNTASTSAVVLFTLTTTFLAFNIGLQVWLMRTDDYRENVLRNDHDIPLEEMEGLMSNGDSSKPQLKADGAKALTVGEMLWVNRSFNLSILIVFVVTMTVFPAVTGFVTSVNTGSTLIWVDPLLFNATQFFLFNLGDFLSRYVPVIPSLFITSPGKLQLLSIARIVFIPILLLCNVSPPKIPVINSDILFMLIVFLLGLSNGYLSAAIQICAASLEYNPKLRNRRVDIDTASNVLGFTLSLGVVVGSVASFAAKATMCGGCNPFIQ